MQTKADIKENKTEVSVKKIAVNTIFYYISPHQMIPIYKERT